MIPEDMKNTILNNISGIRRMKSLLEHNIQDVEAMFSLADRASRVQIMEELATLDPSGRILCRILTMIEKEEDVSYIPDAVFKVAASGYVNLKHDGQKQREDSEQTADTYNGVEQVLSVFLINHEKPIDELSNMLNHECLTGVLHQAAIGRANKNWWITRD